jgi:hypothetical protein
VLAVAAVVSLQQLLEVFKQLTWLGAFGGPCPKPIYLWSNSAAVAELGRGKPRKGEPNSAESTARSYINDHGKRRCVGIPENLKRSQCLPQLLGACSGRECAARSFILLCPIDLRQYPRDFGIAVASMTMNCKPLTRRADGDDCDCESSSVADFLNCLNDEPCCDFWEDASPSDCLASFFICDSCIVVPGQYDRSGQEAARG